MKKVLLIVIAVIFSVLLFTGCSQPNEPSDEFNMELYFPMKVGNWWIYEFYRLDANGNRTNKIQTDSIIVSGIDTINGKPCYVFVEKNVEYSFYPDTGYYFIEGPRLYQLFDPWVGYKSQEDWYILANLKTYNWEMFNIYDTLPHWQSPSYLHAVANMSNNFETKLIFNGDSINCRYFFGEIKYTNRFLGVDSVYVENTIKRYETQFYYSKNIGIIYQKDLLFEGYNQYSNTDIEKVLIDYGPK